MKRVKQQFEIMSIEREVIILKRLESNGCQSCGSSNGCSAKSSNNVYEFKKPPESDKDVGDLITLEINNTELFYKAFFVYLFPIFSLFIGSYLGIKYFPATEAIHIIFGFIGLSLAILFNKLYIITSDTYIVEEMC